MRSLMMEMRSVPAGGANAFAAGFPGAAKPPLFFPFATPPPFARRLVAARPAATGGRAASPPIASVQELCVCLVLALI